MTIRLAALLWMIACTKGDDDAAPDGDGDPPQPCSLAVTEQPTIAIGDALFPLSRSLAIGLSAPARLEITATDATGESVAWVSPTAESHALPLVGLHADGAWTLAVLAIDEADCEVAAEPVAFETGPLPSPLPHIAVLTARPEAMEPGLTLVPIYTKDIAYIALIDDAGRIVWLYGPGPDKFTEVRLLPSGNLLALTDIDVTEIDYMGVDRVWTSESSTTPGGIPVAAPSWHHDVAWSSRDTIVALSKGTIEADDFPLDDDDVSVRGPARVAQDLIVEFDVEGAIVDQWDISRVMDLDRIGYESLNAGEEGFEWTHNNSVDEDVANTRWILSLRNQDAVIAMRQGDGELDWILANPDNWHGDYADLRLDAEGEPFERPYHQHAAKYDAATGRLLLFDNGNFRASPWTGEPATPFDESYSRVVEYTIDEVARTVRQNWDFRLSPDVFSYAMGDADWLANGNVLADFAYIEWVDGEELATYGRGNNSVRVVEFEPLTGEVIWDLDIWGELAEDPNAWQAYRTQRIPRPYAQ